MAPVAYHRDGGRYVIAATMGGAPRHPSWYHNLVKHPEATTEIGTERHRVRATPLPHGSERDRLYRAHADLMPDLGFGEYPKKTKRIIPIVLLEPIDGTSSKR